MTCTYTKIKADDWETVWKTQCGNKVYCKVPEEVGICFAPLPNENGKFCYYCGKEIELKEKP